MMETRAPLDPNPFLTADPRGAAIAVAAPVLVWRSVPGWPHHGFGITSPCSLASVAYIPPGKLTGKFAVFGDDAVEAQPDWLSTAYAENRYRFAHGLCVPAFGSAGLFLWPPQGVVFAKANPTTLRYVPLLRFPAPIEYSVPLSALPPPTARGSQVLIVASSHARSKNGLLAKRLGARLAALLDPDRVIPRIGMSLQVWVADDGCKCIAAAHNYFPKYALYLDGVRFDWEAQVDFQRFDGYDVPVEWRAFLAFRLYDALRPFPLLERYPGACLIGWYREIDSSGSITWCADAPLPFGVRFSAPTASNEVLDWWNNLDALIKRLDAFFEKGQEAAAVQPVPRWSDDEHLAKLWRTLMNDATLWRRNAA